jgi:hypothetical protein
VLAAKISVARLVLDAASAGPLPGAGLHAVHSAAAAKNAAAHRAAAAKDAVLRLGIVTRRTFTRPRQARN